MDNFSEINTLELKAKENRLITDTETLRLKVISDLNIIERNCAQIREIQLELIKRENATTTPES